MKGINGLLLIYFLFLSGIGCAVYRSPADFTGEISSDPKHWKLGVQLWTFHVYSFVESIEKADSAGLKYIEAFNGQPLGAGMPGSFDVTMSVESKTKIKDLLAKKNISMVSMGVISPATIEEWKKSFELGKEFNIQYITAEPHKDQLKSIDSMAEQYRIKVAIHDHAKPGEYWHPDSVLAAGKGLRHIGACADVGHWARSGLNPVDCLQKLRGHIYGLHLKDIKTFDNVEAQDTVVGKGVIHFPAIFQELRDQKFTGMVAIEHESNWYHNLSGVKEIISYCRREIAKLK